VASVNKEWNMYWEAKRSYEDNPRTERNEDDGLYGRCDNRPKYCEGGKVA
jgi:hypothetical protein